MPLQLLLCLDPRSTMVADILGDCLYRLARIRSSSQCILPHITRLSLRKPQSTRVQAAMGVRLARSTRLVAEIPRQRSNIDVEHGILQHRPTTLNDLQQAAYPITKLLMSHARQHLSNQLPVKLPDCLVSRVSTTLHNLHPEHRLVR